MTPPCWMPGCAKSKSSPVIRDLDEATEARIADIVTGAAR